MEHNFQAPATWPCFVASFRFAPQHLPPNIRPPLFPESASLQAKPDGPNFFAYFEGTRWAQPSLPHLRQLMRHVVTHREEARAKGQAARRYLEANFSPEAVARGLQQLVLDVQRRAEEKAQAHQGVEGG